MKEIIDWITDENGNVIVDTIIRYENNVENDDEECECQMGREFSSVIVESFTRKDTAALLRLFCISITAS